jgi:hypothetical protein
MEVGAGLIERIEARVALAVAAFETVEIKAELPFLSAVSKVGVDLTRWVKAMEDARASARRAEAIGNKAESSLRALIAGAVKPANDVALTPKAEEADMDADGNPTTPEELAEYNRWVRAQFAGVLEAPEQKSVVNRAQRRRERAISKRVGGPGA